MTQLRNSSRDSDIGDGDLMRVDYTEVTEVAGSKVSSEQLARMCQRYYFASQFCEGKDVLEVACGSGQGLGYLAKRARKVIGGDCTENLVKIARKYYQDRIEIKQLDAHKLPFGDNCFDVVILYEAIYYLAQPEKFVGEACRVLRKDGVLLICTVNKDWSDFNPSPFSTKYFSVPELFQLLSLKFSKVELYGAFPVSSGTVRDKIVSVIKRLAIAFHLMPKTMKGKEALKRLFLGKLLTLPSEVEDGMAEYCPPVPISCDSPNFQYKVLFAVARL